MKTLNASMRRGRSVDQMTPLDDRQVKNSAGGFVYRLDPWKSLDRFLAIGAWGTMYKPVEKVVEDKTGELGRLIAADADQVRIRAVRALENRTSFRRDSQIYTLARCAVESASAYDRDAFLEAAVRVLRTGTDFLMFVGYLTDFSRAKSVVARTWREAKPILSTWYTGKTVEQVAFQVAKYYSREGWSHRDVLRMLHPVPRSADSGTRKDADMSRVFNWIVKQDYSNVEGLGMIDLKRRLMDASGEQEVVAILKQDPAVWEIVPTEYRKSPSVWRALLPHMGIVALVRNLGNLSKCGLLSRSNPDVIDFVVKRIEDDAARMMHPMQLLFALRTYGGGHGMLSDASWVVVSSVVSALDRAMSESFDHVEPTGKSICIAFDVSSSMDMSRVQTGDGKDTNVTARDVCAVMAKATINAESDVSVVAFSHELRTVPLTKNMSMQQMVEALARIPMGSTDCALPMIWAREDRRRFDAFVVYTDNETWSGREHPPVALNKYRQAMGIPASMIVCGVTDTGFTIADPNDARSMDIAGFSADTPQAISKFIAGEF